MKLVNSLLSLPFRFALPSPLPTLLSGFAPQSFQGVLRSILLLPHCHGWCCQCAATRPCCTTPAWAASRTRRATRSTTTRASARSCGPRVIPTTPARRPRCCAPMMTCSPAPRCSCPTTFAARTPSISSARLHRRQRSRPSRSPQLLHRPRRPRRLLHRPHRPHRLLVVIRHRPPLLRLQVDALSLPPAFTSCSPSSPSPGVLICTRFLIITL